MSVCRVCLCSKPRKDITQLAHFENGKKIKFFKIIWFSLGIQIPRVTNVTRKLCIKCYIKIIQIYKFKKLALKNDTHLRTVEAKKRENILKQSKLSQSDPRKDNIKEEIIESYERSPSPSHSVDYNKDLIIVRETYKEEVQCDDKITQIKNFKPESTIEPKAIAEISLNKTIKDIPTKDAVSYPCKFCGLWFKKRCQLYKHRAKHHVTDLFECEKCRNKYTYKKSYLKHMRLVHCEDRECYLCHYCSKSYQSKQSLIVHLRLHTNEKPFSCPDCGKSWRSMQLLKFHRITHIKEKNFNCTICDKSFISKNYLDKHMKNHAKERNYPCQFCDAKFYRPDTRKRHEFTAHLRYTAPVGEIESLPKYKQQALRNT